MSNQSAHSDWQFLRRASALLFIAAALAAAPNADARSQRCNKRMVNAGLCGEATTANRPPVISGSPSSSGREGLAYSFTPVASDPDGNPIAFSISMKPSWANFSVASGALTGTPPVGSAGTYSGIVISVSDGTLSTSLPSFQIVVDSGNRAPAISGSPQTAIVEGQAYAFTPTASDPDSNPTLTFSIANKPSWATFNSASGSLTGTPGTGTVGTYSNIQITVSDGSLQATLAPFSITVQQAASGAATLSWLPPTTRTDGTPLTNLSGYKVRYGNASGNYPNTVTLSNPGLTSYMVSNLASGTYFFVMAAYDSTGAESANSSPVSKSIN